ncbi:transmembrane protein, putative [Medicago truncatula]|uniref:Transmembrane protein, putative n=1 Tax=Medicago truncatula TaxID=3880 RepID=G7J097_MEDTR|nr:transmembrane protein, putative [Medicago truncatula]
MGIFVQGEVLVGDVGVVVLFIVMLELWCSAYISRLLICSFYVANFCSSCAKI